MNIKYLSQYNWRKRNQEKVKEINRLYRVNNPEKIKLQKIRWRKAHRKEIAEHKRKYRLQKKELVQAERRRYYLKNKDKIIEKNKNWVKNNREKYRKNAVIKSQRRRARKKNAIGHHTLEQWEDLKKKYNYTCPNCKRQEPEIKLTEDHIIPLSRGGSNFIENIQPLCKSCNSKKGFR